MKRYKKYITIRGRLTNSKIVHKTGFFIGLNQDTDSSRVKYIIKTFDEFFKNKGL